MGHQRVVWPPQDWRRAGPREDACGCGQAGGGCWLERARHREHIPFPPELTANTELGASGRTRAIWGHRPRHHLLPFWSPQELLLPGNQRPDFRPDSWASTSQPYLSQSPLSARAAGDTHMRTALSPPWTLAWADSSARMSCLLLYILKPHLALKEVVGLPHFCPSVPPRSLWQFYVLEGPSGNPPFPTMRPGVPSGSDPHPRQL